MAKNLRKTISQQKLTCGKGLLRFWFFHAVRRLSFQLHEEKRMADPRDKCENQKREDHHIIGLSYHVWLKRHGVMPTSKVPA